MSTCAPRSREDLIQIARGIVDLDDKDAAKVLSDVRNKPPGAFYWTWVQGLISGIVTHAKYLGANEAFALMQHGIETPLAAAIGQIRRVAGSDDRYLFGESAAGLWGHFSAVPTAFKAAAQAVRRDMNVPSASESAAFTMATERNAAAKAAGQPTTKIPLPLQRAIERSGTPSIRPEIFTEMGARARAETVAKKLFGMDDPPDWLINSVGKTGDMLGNVIGIPGRSAKGIHTFFRILGEESSLRAQAYRQAVQDGKTPTEALSQKMADIRNNATEDMHNKAVEDGYYGTFMGEMSESAKNFQRWAKNSPVGKWFFPFTHIPRALLSAGAERMPGVALLSKDVRDAVLGNKGGRAQDMAIARMVLGSSVLGYFAMKFLNGEATGDYPTDQGQQRQWKLQGKIPNSILIGNRWVSLNKFGPAGSLASLGANVGSVIGQLKSDDDEAMSKAVWMSAETAYHYIGDEVGFQSLANLFDAMHDENKAISVAATSAATFMPFSSLTSQTASIIDPQMRQVKTLLDGIKYRIPLERETLLPKLDALGRPMANPQYGSIVRQQQVDTDPVVQEMANLGINLAPPQDRVKGVKLPPQLYQNYQMAAGELTRSMLGRFVQQPGWYNLPPYVRREAFNKTIAKSREAAAALMQMRYPQIIQQAASDKLGSLELKKPGKLLDIQP